MFAFFIKFHLNLSSVYKYFCGAVLDAVEFGDPRKRNLSVMNFYVWNYCVATSFKSTILQLAFVAHALISNFACIFAPIRAHSYP